jgi:hypothetical protein
MVARCAARTASFGNVENSANAREEDLTYGRQFDPPLAAREQLDPDFTFERADLVTEVWLRHRGAGAFDWPNDRTVHGNRPRFRQGAAYDAA